MTISDLPPGLVLIFGALLLPFAGRVAIYRNRRDLRPFNPRPISADSFSYWMQLIICTTNLCL